MTKQELIHAFAVRQNVSTEIAKKVFDVVLTVIEESLITTGTVKLSSKFGTFELKRKPGRSFNNFGKSETITLPDKTVVIFKSSQALKDKVKDIEL